MCKATWHVNGTDRMANGICRLIVSFLPKHRKYYGTMLSSEEVDRRMEEEEDARRRMEEEENRYDN
jgi:hypothetical protein